MHSLNAVIDFEDPNEVLPFQHFWQYEVSKFSDKFTVARDRQTLTEADSINFVELLALALLHIVTGNRGFTTSKTERRTDSI